MDDPTVVTPRRPSCAARVWAVIGVGALVVAIGVVAASVLWRRTFSDSETPATVLTLDATEVCFESRDGTSFYPPDPTHGPHVVCLGPEEVNAVGADPDVALASLRVGDCVGLRNAYPGLRVTRGHGCELDK